MGTALDAVRGMLEAEGGQTRFVDWLSNETTQTMIAAARALARPARPTQECNSDFQLGRTVGGNEIIDFLSAPHSLLRTLDAISRMPLADYGARALLDKGDA